ncbi:hypothetical protein SISSUDRAFT_783805 [Sistotremastrum suecicum HHB10207 ss-3]|uniref:Uncharacterized protein n=1 Tax=Sistotremastrum suecicum HHB10207 ss-3 TaxID=1314776 RepID=A0A166D2J9_9AGAM|nr:hypothetical protein SISSUDRAFT_783805 [Sistotremastrum suecicum HHB10207 ss-3]
MSRPTSELGGLGEKMDEPADIVRQNSTDLKEENDNRNCTAVVSSDVIYTSTRSIKQNSPIFCLPGELILYIVLIAVDEVSMERQSGGGENPPEIHCERVSYRQLQVTTRMAHVCSLWRHVCVQATTLWNTIDLLWPSNAIELFTSRVRYTPLRLILSPVLDYESATHLMTLDSSTFWNGQIAFWTDFITQNMHRVKSLEITMIIDDLEDNFHDFWDSIRPLKAPMLEKFSIRVAPYMSCVRMGSFSKNLT